MTIRRDYDKNTHGGIDYDSDWRTVHEIRFISKLGSYRNDNSGYDGIRSEVSRKQLLERYISAVEGRIDWGRINKNKVIAYATKLLNEAE